MTEIELERLADALVRHLAPKIKESIKEETREALLELLKDAARAIK